MSALHRRDNVQYDWILFDADETLFSFDALAGLKTMFNELDVDFTEQDFAEYEAVNKPLWVKYQNGEITAKQLQEERFMVWANRLDIAPAELNRRFLKAMADVCQPLEGVREILPLLAQKAKLGIITNGFVQLQQIRLEKTGLREYFEWVVISEEVGVAKPDVAIFEHAFQLMEYPDKARILMVGDNADSDIRGGINAGIDTCWLNVDGKPLPEDIEPTFVATSWAEIHAQLLG
ncbi:Pyrimidine 5'-nucleotidase YjjG [Grimontia hollisae]|uniref:Pyrimidine 5'-nucleotidase YjjG n=1 Tax=Grimontia hollisae TaxID=673 RepID=A0A377HLG2_GRIHO|nr:Pyrimidine 5'-nucleotidase YjjG [Grimontia hollisae]STO56552.1 Pyrimidine 5'-nucleotidase YjjG [Grimontia hollisae]STQ77396.1 Pyrimidine 5'-nucleotidase YjjG [Grimontia hollisae]